MIERAAGICLAIWAFLLVGRLPEFLSELTGFPVRPFLILYPLVLVMLLLSGGFLRALDSRVGQALLLLTLWFAFAVPFSLWRGGSTRWLLLHWLPNMLTFTAFAVLIFSLAQWRRAAMAIGWATPMIALTVFRMGREDWMGRVSAESGTLSNANELAALFLVGLPFWVGSAQAPSSSMLRKLTVYGSLPLLIYLVFRTGSRSGVLTLGVLIVMFVLHLKGVTRYVVIAATAAVLLAAVAAMPDTLRVRLTTFFESEPEREQQVSASAAGSSQLRKDLLIESVKGALTHPLVGVGPGVFALYSGYESEKIGPFRGWKDAHNTYTQVASEAGLPAFAFFLAALISSFRTVIHVYRTARSQANLREICRESHVFLMSLTGFSFFALFDSIHHLPLLFMLMGLAISYSRAAASVLPAPLPRPSRPTTPPAAFNPTRTR